MKFSAFIPVLFICLFFAACGSEKAGSDPQEVEDADSKEVGDSSDDEIRQDLDFSENDEDSTQIDDEQIEPDGDATESVVNLSEAGTANCYIVKTAGNYSFDATVRGNGEIVEGVDFNEGFA